MRPPRLRRAASAALALLLLASCAERAPQGPPAVAAGRTWSYLTEQTAFGPRVPGLPGHERQLRWMRRFLEVRADTVLEQRVPSPGAAGRPAPLTNLLARFNAGAPRRVLLVAGWDSPPRGKDGFSPGANESASGVAVLLELAELFRQRAPAAGVDLLLVDGASQGADPARRLAGIRHFAGTLPPGSRPVWAVVLRRVGDREPGFPREGLSSARASAEVERLWGRARELGLAHVFLNVAGDSVRDAHAVLQEAGIPAVLISDPLYGPGNRWVRSPQDRPGHVSRETLASVARVLADLIYREAGR